MATVDDLEHALANTSRLLAGVREDQWGEPSPCEKWSVREVANHVTWVVQMFGAATRGEAPPNPQESDVVGTDPAGAFDAAAQTALTGWRALPSLDGAVEMPFGPLPAGVALGINVLDVYVHGWDVARATGQDPQLDDDLSASTLAIAEAIVPADGRGDNFAPVVEVSDTAPVAERLLGYTGRNP